MMLMVYVLLGMFLIIEGLNRMGVNFNGSELVKGILLFISGLLVVVEYL